MVTLAEIKEQVDKVKIRLGIFDQFDAEILKVTEELELLKKQQKAAPSFEVFQSINSKQGYLSELKQQRAELEKKELSSVANDIKRIQVYSFLSNELERNEEVKSQRQTIKQKSIELLELLENYNENYRKTAQKLAEEVSKTGFSELVGYLNDSEEYQRVYSNYISDDTVGYTGDRMRYLDTNQELTYLIDRVNYLLEND